MLQRLGIIVVLALVVIQQASCDGDAKIREDRQAPLIGFRLGDGKVTFLTLGGDDRVQLTSLNPALTGIVEIGAGEVVHCEQLDGVGTATHPSGVLSEISSCANVSVGSEGVDLDIFDSNSVNFSGPGELYFGPNMVLFVEESGRGLSALIEANRPTFVPVIPPLDVEIATRVNNLVLNLDDVTAGEDRPPVSTNDAIRLTGSNCSNVRTGESLSLSSETLRVRQGLRVVMSVTGIRRLESVLSQTIAGQVCEVLNRGNSGRIPGPGLLCVGDSPLASGERVAFFSNSTSTNDFIMERLVDRLLRFQDGAGGPSIMGNFMPNVGRSLVRLSGVSITLLPAASIIEQVDGVVRINTRFGNTLQTRMCMNGVTLAHYHLNNVMVFAPTGSAGPFNAPPGGLTTVFNPDDCTVFAYPTSNNLITQLLTVSRNLSTTTPPSRIVFQVVYDGLGGSNLTANNITLLTSSSATSFRIGAGQSVTYSSNMVNILNSGSSTPANSFSGINNFVANTAFNRLVTSSGGANNAANGPGNLYVDSNRRAFFTNSLEVAGQIDNSVNNVPAQRVDIIITGVNRTTVSLQIGGNRFFDLPSSDMCNEVSMAEAVGYANNTVLRGNAVQISRSSTLTYFPDENVLQVVNDIDTTNFTNINNFYVGQTSSTQPMEIVSVTSIPGGGVVYLGQMTGVYYPSLILPTGNALNFLMGIDVFPTTVPNIGMCSFYDGTRVQMFSGSSLSLLPGPGFLCTSTDSCFYTNNQDLSRRIPVELARLRPATTMYDSNTRVISVIDISGEFIANFSISSRTVRVPGGILTFSGGNISTMVGNISTIQLITGDIRRLIFFDGSQTMIFDDGDLDVNLPGDGLLVIDEAASGSTAFYTVNNQLAGMIMNTFTNVMVTFNAPDIPDTEPDELTSKLNEVDTGFGQLLTVYEGANVNLKCNGGNANPPAMISFFVRSNFTGVHPFAPVVNSSDFMIIVNDDNDVTLRVPSIALGEVEFLCAASNAVGTSARTTRIKVRPQVPPTIDNSFFAGRLSPGEQTVTARSSGSMLTITPLVAPIALNTRIASTSLLTDTVLIGCKANGRPKANIAWTVSVNGAAPVDVDTSGPEVNVTSARQGQSVLTVELDNTETLCLQYICNASINGMSVQGAAEVCPRRIDAEAGTTDRGECSATCGIGVQLVTPTFSVSFNNTILMSTFSELPVGLVKPQVNFCSMPECPVIEIDFMVGDYSNCSEFCGNGIRIRDVQCVLTVDGMVNQTLDDSECTMLKPVPRVKPVEREDCDNGRCPDYLIGPYGPCSRTCGGGVETRELRCIMPVMGSHANGIIVDIEICYNNRNRPRPVESRMCNVGVLCPVRYSPGPYGQCDQFNCERREVFCSNFDPADPTEAWPANDSLCEEQNLVRLSTVRSCGGGTCQFGTWSATAIMVPEDPNRSCSVECGQGVQKQNVVCFNATETDPNLVTIEDGYCHPLIRPGDEVPCLLRNCPGQCLTEPFLCTLIQRMRLCKEASLASITQNCCASCPFQATPIPPLPEEGDTSSNETMAG